MENEKLKRLDRFLSEQKVATRSQIKKILKNHKICVNGIAVKDGSFKINPNIDEITIDGKIISNTGFLYVMLYKPIDCITATRDDKIKTVMDCIGADILKRDELCPVGRLDKDTTGLLVLTNDGALNHKLMSPRSHVEKTYIAEVDRPLSDFDKAVLECDRGLDIGDEKLTRSALLQKSFDDRHYLLTITEGRFHQVKRMFWALGVCVVSLKRISIGELMLDEKLTPGEYRLLTDEEIKLLKGKS